MTMLFDCTTPYKESIQYYKDSTQFHAIVLINFLTMLQSFIMQLLFVTEDKKINKKGHACNFKVWLFTGIPTKINLKFKA